MLCYSCHKDISMKGSNCPYCGSSKSRGKSEVITPSFLGVCGLVLGSGVGFYFGGWMSGLIAAGVGSGIGVFVAMVLESRSK